MYTTRSSIARVTYYIKRYQEIHLIFPQYPVIIKWRIEIYIEQEKRFDSAIGDIRIR